jgi:hypothetical protein
LDTGSDFTAFPCKLCNSKHCGKHNNPWFNQKGTKTISEFKCNSYFEKYKCKMCMPDKQCKFERIYSEDIHDGLKGPVYFDVMTIGDGKDILSPPAGYKNLKIYKNSFLDKRRRYLNPVKMMFGCTINEPK